MKGVVGRGAIVWPKRRYARSGKRRREDGSKHLVVKRHQQEGTDRVSGGRAPLPLDAVKTRRPNRPIYFLSFSCC